MPCQRMDEQIARESTGQIFRMFGNCSCSVVSNVGNRTSSTSLTTELERSESFEKLRTDSRNRVDCSRRRIPIAAVAGDGWYHEDLNLTLVSDCMYFLIELSVVRGEHDVENIIYSLAHVAMLYWRIQGSDVVQDFVELVFTGSQPPPPHQLAEVQRQRASVRAAAKSVRVLCLGPHRLDVLLRVGASGWLHEVQRVVDAQVLELMFNEAPVRPPPVCYDGSSRAHMTLYDGEEGGG
ncbi:hypothetical protein M513_12487 [Trichuris suis]|uniref:Uncharacterized protein n=1 Tax=Trichuris suis TaxID=68888 RepID=A0A085LNT6_9BILA|nr:hypothetical protein M513_12487 [Trichuris suis]